jgi:hypothetical protein
METDRSTPEPVARPWLKARSSRRFALVDCQLGVSLFTTVGIVASVIALWLLGKLSWNHDPQTSQPFLPATSEMLTSRPQSAALEFHHALTTGNFVYAQSLAHAKAGALVDEVRASCADACPSPKASRGKVFTRATLLEAKGRYAKARAESFDRDNTLLQAATYELWREDDRWSVTSRTN